MDFDQGFADDYAAAAKKHPYKLLFSFIFLVALVSVLIYIGSSMGLLENGYFNLIYAGLVIVAAVCHNKYVDRLKK